jgi:ABC-2 type transport system permease protein
MKPATAFGKKRRRCMSKAWLAAGTLWQREMVRFYRQPSRVVGAIASPFLFWILLGSGLGSSFQSSDHSGQNGYLSYFFPGTLLLVLFFTAVFSTISIIEDRKEGFMQAVLVAPVPRWSLVLGKVMGGSSLALLQAALFLVFAAWLGIDLDFAGWIRMIAVLFLNACLMTCLGFLLAWQFQSIQGFHAVMNMLLMPMWILSGALFPAEGASSWVRFIMQINPLTYSLALLRSSLFSTSAGDPVFMKSLVISLVLTAGFFAAACLTARQNKVSA